MQKIFSSKMNVALTLLVIVIIAYVAVSAAGTKTAAETPIELYAEIVEERLDDTQNTRISLPRFQSNNSELDRAVNANIDRIIRLDEIRAFIAENEEAGVTDFDAQVRFKCRSIGGVFSVMVSVYEYSGGAHGIETRYEIYIDRNTGDFYTLTDLFTQPEPALARIALLIQNKINSDYDSFFADASSIPLPDTFTFGKKSLDIYYPPYQIAPYASGFVHFEIPFAEIERYIDREGAFYTALMAR